MGVIPVIALVLVCFATGGFAGRHVVISEPSISSNAFGHGAHIYDIGQSLRVFGVSNGNSIVQVGENTRLTTNDYWCFGAVVRGHLLAFLSGSVVGLDVSSASAPKILWQQQPQKCGLTAKTDQVVFTWEDDIFVMSLGVELGSAQFVVYSLDEACQLTYRSDTTVSDAYGLALYGNFLYAGTRRGIQIFDIEDLERPRRKGTVRSTEPATGMAKTWVERSGEYLFVVDASSSTVFTLLLDDPLAPSIRESKSFVGSAEFGDSSTFLPVTEWNSHFGFVTFSGEQYGFVIFRVENDGALVQTTHLSFAGSRPDFSVLFQEGLLISLDGNRYFYPLSE